MLETHWMGCLRRGGPTRRGLFTEKILTAKLFFWLILSSLAGVPEYVTHGGSRHFLILSCLPQSPAGDLQEWSFLKWLRPH